MNLIEAQYVKTYIYHVCVKVGHCDRQFVQATTLTFNISLISNLQFPSSFSTRRATDQHPTGRCINHAAISTGVSIPQFGNRLAEVYVNSAVVNQGLETICKI